MIGILGIPPKSLPVTIHPNRAELSVRAHDSVPLSLGECLSGIPPRRREHESSHAVDRVVQLDLDHRLPWIAPAGSASNLMRGRVASLARMATGAASAFPMWLSRSRRDRGEAKVDLYVARTQRFGKVRTDTGLAFRSVTGATPSGRRLDGR